MLLRELQIQVVVVVPWKQEGRRRLEDAKAMHYVSSAAVLKMNNHSSKSAAASPFALWEKYLERKAGRKKQLSLECLVKRGDGRKADCQGKTIPSGERSLSMC